MEAVGTYRCDVALFEARAIFGVHRGIDAGSAADFEREVHAVLVPPRTEVVIDLNYATLLDSVGVDTLTRLRTQADELGMQLRLTSIPRPIETTLRSYGLADAFGLSPHKRPTAAR